MLGINATPLVLWYVFDSIIITLIYYNVFSVKEMMTTARRNKPIHIPFSVYITPLEFPRVFNALFLNLNINFICLLRNGLQTVCVAISCCKKSFLKPSYRSFYAPLIFVNFYKHIIILFLYFSHMQFLILNLRYIFV